ncbi:hypothetical protein LIER_09155 [Lithospermum erythrorhizon]|uniref:Reverse transcriptase RNase H-like domain-containing protein n=1 Tax=Lithospermum erythrorhizon TaxID=34254 RepID=A0AAV3PGU7_LITER
MRGAETRYPLTEQLIFALIVATRKLKSYFEAPPVEDITMEEPEAITMIKATERRVWLLYIDRASNPGSSGAEYGLMYSSTLVEWVIEEAFRMKEVMNNTLKNEGSVPRPWYLDILEFLSSGILLEDPAVAKVISLRRWFIPKVISSTTNKMHSLRRWFCGY